MWDYGGVNKSVASVTIINSLFGARFSGEFIFEITAKIGILGLQPVRYEHMRLIGHFSPGSVQDGTLAGCTEYTVREEAR
jgi:hypothetical protein